MSEPRPFSEFQEHGLLWLINRAVFHPRGYALAFEVDEHGEVTGWDLLGDGTEPWTYDPSIDEQECFAAVENFLPVPEGCVKWYFP